MPDATINQRAYYTASELLARFSVDVSEAHARGVLRAVRAGMGGAPLFAGAAVQQWLDDGAPTIKSRKIYGAVKPGATPTGGPGGGGAGSAQEAFGEAVRAKMATGMTTVDAVRAVRKEDPGLHRRMIHEANADRPDALAIYKAQRGE